MSIKALREKIANFSKEANHLLAEKGSASWTPEEQAKFDGFTNEIEGARRQIANIEKMRELDADKFFNEAPGKKVELEIGDILNAVQATTSSVPAVFRVGGVRACEVPIQSAFEACRQQFL